ncbi:LLM class F420-dependent oxidoreductase, partial [Streptomyces sp. NPDC001478]
MTSQTHKDFGRIGIWSGALRPSRTDDAGRAAIAEAVAELDEEARPPAAVTRSPSPPTTASPSTL